MITTVWSTTLGFKNSNVIVLAEDSYTVIIVFDGEREKERKICTTVKSIVLLIKSLSLRW